MALQLITGVSGSGKSTRAFDMVSEIAAADRNRPVFVLVPDQFSQEAGRILIEKNAGAILNIDVLSFRRMAYRALEEYRGYDRAILGDEGKIMLLRKVIAEHKNELEYFTKGLDRPGFLDECKSLLCELIEYGIGDESFESIEEMFGEKSRSAAKIRDIRLLYHYMEDRLGDTYRLAEELIPLLTRLVPTVSFLKDAVICLDDFTGFTPVQYDLIGALMKRCQQVIITVTTDRNTPVTEGSDDAARPEVFSLSTTTIRKLTRLASSLGVTVNESIITGHGESFDSYRLRNNPVLQELERKLFTCETKKKDPVSDDRDPADNNTEKSSAPDASETDNNPFIFPVRIRVCQNIRNEAEFAAREAKRLIHAGFDPSDIAVITPDMERYEPHIRHAFEALQIPFFFDRNKSIGMNPLAEYILSFFSMLRQGFDCPGVIRWLRCGLSPVTSPDDIDRFENYLLATGRRGFRAFTGEWTYDAIPGRVDLAEINRTRETFAGAISETVENLRGGKKPVRTIAQILCELLIRTDVPGRLEQQRERLENTISDTQENRIQSRTSVTERRLLAEEYGKIYPAFLSLLDMMVDLMGDEMVSLREFEEILQAGIGGSVMGFVPPSDHQVLVGDIERSRLGEIRILFFLGNTDSAFSGGGSSVSLLTDRERQRIEESGIELAPSAETLRNQQMFYLYRLLTRPSQGMVLTFPRLDEEGKDERPSYLIEQVQTLFSDTLTLEDDENDRPSLFTGNKNPLPLTIHTASLSPQTAAALYGDSLVASVSRFESYARCPYAHFLNYGLRLAERVECHIGYNDRGSLFHNALEHLSTELHRKGEDFTSISEDELCAQGDAAFEEAACLYRDDLFHQDKRKEYVMKRMKRIYRSALLALRTQWQAGEFHQAGWEVVFSEKASGPSSIPAPSPEELPNGHQIRLHGRIDRYDLGEDGDTRYIKLVDYKSSARELSLPGIYAGLEMQLTTYLHVLMQYYGSWEDGKKACPAALFYQKIDEGETAVADLEMDEGQLRTMRTRDFRPSGFINSDDAVIHKLDKILPGNGADSDVVPLKINRDGSFSKYSAPRLLTTERFEELMEKTRANIRQCGTEIYEGRIAAEPYRWDERTGRKDFACQYCNYAGVCGVEARTRDSISRVLSAEIPENPAAAPTAKSQTEVRNS